MPLSDGTQTVHKWSLQSPSKSFVFMSVEKQRWTTIDHISTLHPLRKNVEKPSFSKILNWLNPTCMWVINDPFIQFVFADFLSEICDYCHLLYRIYLKTFRETLKRCQLLVVESIWWDMVLWLCTFKTVQYPHLPSTMTAITKK